MTIGEFVAPVRVSYADDDDFGVVIAVHDSTVLVSWTGSGCRTYERPADLVRIAAGDYRRRYQLMLDDLAAYAARAHAAEETRYSD